MTCVFTNTLFSNSFEDCLKKVGGNSSDWLLRRIEQSVAEMVLLLCLPAHLVVRKNNDGDFEASYIDKVCFANLRTNESPRIIFKKDDHEVVLTEEYKQYYDILVKIAFCLRSPIWRSNLYRLIIWYSKKRSQRVWSDDSLEGRIAWKIDDLIFTKAYSLINASSSSISTLLNKIVHFKDDLLKGDKMNKGERERRRGVLQWFFGLLLSGPQFQGVPDNPEREPITLPEEPLLKVFCQVFNKELCDNLKPVIKNIIHEDLKPAVKELVDDFKKSDTGKSFHNLKDILLNFQARASVVYCFTNWFYVGFGGTINLRKHASVCLCMGGIISKEFLLFLKKAFVEMILIEAVCIDNSIVNFEHWQESYSLNVFVLFSFFKYRYFGLVLGGGVQKMNSGFKIGVFYMGGYKDPSVKV